MADLQASEGALNWRLSAHPITLVTFLAFRAVSLLVYLLGFFIIDNFVLTFIITILLLAADFYYLKNIAGRRLVGLRWWNEANAETGDSHWVFESAPQPNEPGGRLINSTDKRFFWLALYAQPALWIGFAILAVIKFQFIYLTLVDATNSARRADWSSVDCIRGHWRGMSVALWFLDYFDGEEIC